MGGAGRGPLNRALALSLIGAGMALADEPARKPPPEPADAEFLEFLGSIGSDDDGWINFLSQTDPAAAARVAAAKTPPPANGGKKNDKSQDP
jgi:hypothetical protein